MRDRFGIGWRPELAAQILANSQSFDLIEVIADDYFERGASGIEVLKTLNAQIPLVLHGVGLGLAAIGGIPIKKLDSMARLVEKVKPLYWSEHLAMVRGGGIEIGHLAPQIRDDESIEATLRNIERCAKLVGFAPHLENIAALFQPPGSTYSESEWLSEIARESGAPLLLDLHNVHTNGYNFHFDPQHFLTEIPLASVGTIHISGGRLIRANAGDKRQRILDDHLHPVPPMVYQLLEIVAANTDQPLQIILERDGEFPPLEELLAELNEARRAVARGRHARLRSPQTEQHTPRPNEQTIQP